MTSLKLYGHKWSLCTRRVLLVLAEKELQFEFVPIDFMHGENKRSPYIDLHPFGVIPLLQDGTFSLYESRAIARYLALKYRKQGTSLLPSTEGAEEWGVFEQWASVEYSQFHNVAEAVLTQKMFNPARGLPSDEAATIKSVDHLSEKLDVLDKVLAKQRYMAGEDFSLIDIFYMPVMHLLCQAGESDSLEKRPNVKLWWDTVQSRNSWAEINSASP